MEKRTKIPEWATHVATNSDGWIYAFNCESEIIQIPIGRKENEVVDVWEPINEDGIYKFICNSEPDLFWHESEVTIDDFKRTVK